MAIPASDPPLRNLADVCNALGNHSLYKAMGMASDWLVTHQFLNSTPPHVVCRSTKNITDWQGAFVGDYHPAKARDGCPFSPPLGPFWHVGQAVKALTLAAATPVPEGVHPGYAGPSQQRWRTSADLAAQFLLRQIREDGLVAGALENSDIHPQTSTAMEGLGALFSLSNATTGSHGTADVYAEAGIRAATWYATNMFVLNESLMWDFYNLSNEKPITTPMPTYIRLNMPVVPGVDDGVLLDAWVAAGRPGSTVSPLRATNDAMLNRMLRDEHPSGNWDAYLLCDGRSDVLCHRRGHVFLPSPLKTSNLTPCLLCP